MMVQRWIAVLLLAIAVPAQADEEVTLTNGEWPPYTSQQLKHYGVFSHIVSEAFALSGYHVKYSFFPWKRSYAAAKSGAFDGSVTWAPTDERRLDFYFTDPVTYNRKVLFHLKSFPFDYRTVEDLKRYRIGATAQYTYGKQFDQAVTEGAIQVDLVTRDIQNVRRLLHDRIDIFPMEIEVGYALIFAELPVHQAALITNHSRPIMESPISVVISRQIPESRAKKLLAAFNEGLEKLKASGRYDEMIWHSRQGGYRLDQNLSKKLYSN